MPSIKTKDVMTLSSLYKMGLAIACAGLVACGGGSGTSRGSNSNTTDDDDTDLISMTVNIPMYVQNASLEVHLAGRAEPIYTNNDFTGFETEEIELQKDDLQKVLVVTLSSKTNSLIFDPIQIKNTPFNGKIHAVDTMANDLNINLTPLSESVYQRTLVRSGNLDFENPDYSLINIDHITKASTELNKFFNQAFNLKDFPKFSHSQSISAIQFEVRNQKQYINSFLSLGMLNLWQSKFPNSTNSYVDLSTNIAIDLRDGYLDGRSIAGDSTSFLKLVTAPKNIDPALNNSLDIGLLQEEVRTTFGEDFKAYTLDIAEKSFQSILNPTGLNALNYYEYYQDYAQATSTSTFRWTGAGDYRAAFGFTSTATCETSALPCKQGLNADDIGARFTDIEYLVGTHTVQNCKVEILASGDVRLTKGNQTIAGQINRDKSDNLLRVDGTTRHYILNVGSGEIRPPHFLQFEVKNAEIVSARTGNSQNLYPSLTDLTFGTDDIQSCS